MSRRLSAGTQRNKTGARTGPKKWSRVKGTVYGFRCLDAKGRRTLILSRPKSGVGYVGMYSGWWRERIRQHLYGGGPYHCKPQPWRVLVDGYDPSAVTLKQQRAAVNEVIRRGNAYIIWQKRRLRWSKARGFHWKHMRTFHWWVKLRESWSIFYDRPVHNVLENTENSRHIPKWELEELLAKRELKLSQPAVPRRRLRLESVDDDRWTGVSVTENGSVTELGWYGPSRDSIRTKFEKRIGS